MVQLAPELQVAPDAQYQNNQGAGQGGPAQPLQGFEVPQLQKRNAGQYQIQGGADVGEKGAFIGQAGSLQRQVVAQNDVFFQLVVHGGQFYGSVKRTIYTKTLCKGSRVWKPLEEK